MDRPTGERGKKGDVSRRLMSTPFAGRVEGGAGRDEDCAQVLMAQIELDLLERTFN